MSESRGQLFFFIRDVLSLLAAFVLALILITGSIESIQQGQSIEGLLGIGATVSLVAGAFLLRDRHRRKERETPKESLSPSHLPDERSDPG
jgi:general stress protein CsbA